MGEKVLWALLGGVGAGFSLALLPFLTKAANPQGNYLLAVILSIAVFVMASAFVVGTLIVNSTGATKSLSWLIVAVIVSGCIAGALLPWGTFGFWLAFAALAVTIATAIHGLSANTLKSCFGAIVGLVVGGAASTAWSVISTRFEPSSTYEFISELISYGIIVYGITLGLLLTIDAPRAGLK